MLEWSQNELESFFKGKGSGLVYLFTPFCGTCQVAGKMLSVTLELLPHVECGKVNLNYMPEIS